MTIAVALQTCDRIEYTRRTLDSFVAHNDVSQFVLLHGDDGSSEPVCDLAGAYGFETVVRNVERRGVFSTRAALLAAAARRRAQWVLMLENDIETLRPFPWELFDYARRQPSVYCVRLFGAYKDTARLQPCKTTHQWKGNEPVAWRPFRDAPEKSQIGQIHWTPQPAVTRMREALAIHRGDRPMSLTVRVKKNAMAHFGYERTSGRVL